MLVNGYSPISNKRTGTLIFFPILVVRYSYYNPVRLFFLPLFGSLVLLLKCGTLIRFFELEVRDGTF